MSRVALLAAGLLVLSAALCLWWRGRPSREVQTAGVQPAGGESRYHNVRPEVQYVGDQVCAECHPGEAESFRRHPMGQSLKPIGDWTAPDRLGAHNPFREQDFEFRVELRDRQVFHEARRLDPGGQALLTMQAEIRYVVGSGTRGQSYLVERDGYLFQSPISWYARKRVWDLSPGFDAAKWLDRPIPADCLFCHSNRVEPVPDAINRYRTPIFRGYAIGCERCHGPGQLHVQAREQATPVGEEDLTIVNPQRLEPQLREAVCQQCHLEGAARVLRRGRDTFDYRPGLPLGAFWAVYVPASGAAQERLAVGQVEQMYESRCFRASRGALGCLSCHDPHAYPTAAEQVSYYRGRCLHCHEQQGCRLAAAERRQQNNDDCAACHMPRLNSSDIAHTAVSDHRIQRRPGSRTEEQPLPDPSLRGRLELFAGMDVRPSGRDADRDLGLALQKLCLMKPELQPQLTRVAARQLQRALQTRPDDVPVLEARAQCLAYEGKVTEVLALHEKVLDQSPEREASVAGAAWAAAALGQYDKAVTLWQRAIALDPWFAPYHDSLAQTLAKTKRWTEAIRECDTTLRLSPANLQIRTLLIGCLVQSGARDRAGKEFAALLQLDPSNQGVLERWFAQLMKDFR